MMTGLRRDLIALVVLAALLTGATVWGARSARKEQEAAEARRQLETHRRMEDADVSRGDPDDDLDWLRGRAGR